MAKINYNSESREWYIASGTILLVTLTCYSFLNFYVLTEESEILSTVTNAINLSFALLAFSGVLLAFQGYRFSDGKGFLINKDGEEVMFNLEKLFIEADLSVKEKSCKNIISLGLWRPVGHLTLSNGEIEVKEIWFYIYYYRTQIALRGNIPNKIIKKFISNLA